MNRRLLFALAFVLSIASCAAWADKPPKSLMAHVAENQLVHDEQCKFQGEDGIECLIFFDEAREIVWLVLFTDDQQTITRVVAIKDKVETIVWCRHDVCT